MGSVASDTWLQTRQDKALTAKGVTEPKFCRSVFF